ncbi:hypothetical protein KA405_06685 [Patescibacteria group bacterium]|nr:hypothetical protein [Patescibacteria group bacterium]
MIIDHDIGYNMNAFEKMIKKNEKTGDFNKDAFFNATKDHPAYSRIFVDAHTEAYTQIF